MKENIQTYIDPAVKFFISIIGIVFIIVSLKELQSIFIPLVLAYLLFFLFEPLNRLLTKRKIPYSLTLLFDIIITSGVVFSFYRIILSSFAAFESQLPFYQERLSGMVSAAAINLGFKDPALTKFNLSEALKNIDYGGIASQFFSSTLSIVSSGFFILLFFVFVHSGHHKFLEAIKNRFIDNDADSDEKSRVRVEQAYDSISNQVQRYIGAKFVISLATGILIGIVLWIFNVDFLIVWAVLAILLNFIPNIGSFIAVLFPTLVTLVQYNSLGKALLLAGIITILQNIIGNIIEPKIIGKRLGLNPLVILLSLLIWGYIWGIIGMFLSVPLTAIIKIIISNSESKNLKLISSLMSD